MLSSELLGQRSQIRYCEQAETTFSGYQTIILPWRCTVVFSAGHGTYRSRSRAERRQAGGILRFCKPPKRQATWLLQGAWRSKLWQLTKEDASHSFHTCRKWWTAPNPARKLEPCPFNKAVSTWLNIACTVTAISFDDL